VRHLAGVGREADVRISVADLLDDAANDAIHGGPAQSALVVISPETMARSVVTMVSQATRLMGRPSSSGREWRPRSVGDFIRWPWKPIRW